MASATSFAVVAFAFAGIRLVISGRILISSRSIGQHRGIGIGRIDHRHVDAFGAQLCSQNFGQRSANLIGV
jgi:hypothetical protein